MTRSRFGRRDRHQRLLAELWANEAQLLANYRRTCALVAQIHDDALWQAEGDADFAAWCRRVLGVPARLLPRLLAVAHDPSLEVDLQEVAELDLAWLEEGRG